MKRIRIVHIALGMDVGGIENLILSIARSIDRHKFDFSVCCLDSGGILLREVQKLGWYSYILNRRPGFDWKLILQLANFFRKKRYHIVHTHNQASHFYGGIAAKLARVPVLVTTEHSRHYIDAKYRRRLEKLILAKISERWITVSNELFDASIKKDGLPQEKVMVIHNGIDIEAFSRNIKTNLGALKESIGIPHEVKTVIMVARLHPIKNHAMLLRALSQLKGRASKLNVIFVGEGELKGELISIGNHLKLNHRVHFVGLRQDIPDLLYMSDLFVLCSKTEGLPLSLLEAMAAKVPIMITESANRAGLIINGRNGIVVENSSIAIAEALD
ncbi:MAG: glycosyltransferase, partial [Patescibacteria group bacterium]|nr:glycosyltransferase [Patescibacteria group bacterium]